MQYLSKKVFTEHLEPGMGFGMTVSRTTLHPLRYQHLTRAPTPLIASLLAPPDEYAQDHRYTAVSKQ